MKDLIILPVPAPYWEEPFPIPLFEPSVVNTPADTGCMFDAVIRDNPGKTMVLGLVCPCSKCSPWCTSVREPVGRLW